VKTDNSRLTQKRGVWMAAGCRPMPTRFLSERAIFERCRGVLWRQGIRLQENGCGIGRIGKRKLHTVDAETGAVIAWGLTLRRLARRLGVLQAWERAQTQAYGVIAGGRLAFDEWTGVSTARHGRSRPVQNRTGVRGLLAYASREASFMKKLISQAIAASFVILIMTFPHLSAQAPMAKALIEAKTVYLINDGAGQGTFDDLAKELQKWGRWTLVNDAHAADLTITLGGLAPFKGWPMTIRTPDGTQVWSDKEKKGLTKSVAASLVKELRQRLEGKTK
jgi:hypothetical protein